MLAQFATLGSTMAGSVVAGVILGLIVDSYAHSSPWGILGGLVLGSVGAANAISVLLKRWK